MQNAGLVPDAFDSQWARASSWKAEGDNVERSDECLVSKTHNDVHFTEF